MTGFMRKAISVFWLILFFLAVFNATAFAKGEEFNKPIPAEARAAVITAQELRAFDKIDESISLLKKAMTMAPNYVEAILMYLETKDAYADRYNEARDEFLALRSKEPDNPVYLMVAVMWDRYPRATQSAYLKKVAEIAPDWAWGHYAKARTL